MDLPDRSLPTILSRVLVAHLDGVEHRVISYHIEGARTVWLLQRRDGDAWTDPVMLERER